MPDNEVLIQYIRDGLGGAVGAQYADPYGQGRITVLTQTEAPEQPDGPEAPAEPETPDEPPQPARTYTVQAGDCLWNIAARQLGDGRRWNEIYQLNQDILSDPNRIYVGQVLDLPAA